MCWDLGRWPSSLLANKFTLARFEFMDGPVLLAVLLIWILKVKFPIMAPRKRECFLTTGCAALEAPK
eukprot:COSAG01_NODE_123_length_25210_cov_348.799434_1_plen_67_part_00